MKLVLTVGPDGGSRVNKAVFYDNIRDYDEKSAINSAIFSDLKDDGQDSFVFKNNGVTVVAKSLSRTADLFTLEDYQIVNGCQTSNIIYQAGDDSKGVSIPFRLIVSQDDDFVSSIIVGTNRQNTVRDDQFWALKPFMKDLEDYCSNQNDDFLLFVERRENQYRDGAVERTRIIKPSELMKSVAAIFLYQPHRAARDYRGIRSEFESQIFLSDHNVEVYHAAAFANYKFEFAIRNRRIPREWRIYKFFCLYALGYETTGGREVFRMKKSHQKRVASAIIEYAASEDQFIEHVTRCCEAMDKLVQKAGLDTREQIRDYIRSESVVDLFRSSVYEE